MKAIDETAQAQIQYFAASVRRALAADVALVVCTGAADDRPGYVATGSGISCADSIGRAHATAAMLQALLTTASGALQRASGGQARLLIQTGDGLNEVQEVELDRYSFTEGEVT